MADTPPYPAPNRGTGDDTGVGPDLGPAPGTPRWVKVFGIAFLVLVLLIVIMIAGGHGPGRHMAGGGLGGQVPLSSVTENSVRQP